MIRFKFSLVLLVVYLLALNYALADYRVTHQVYLDIQSDKKYIGRIVVGLFGDIAPRTVRNFRTIAEKGINGKTYKGTKFHRVIKRFMIQGGDIINNNGTGHVSIYGDAFKDENFIVKHNGAGVVSMVNTGPDTNGCQFFITTMAAPWVDGHHVVFGRVVKGQDVVHKIEHMKTDLEDRPVKDIIILRSGIVRKHKPFYVNDVPYEITFWAWIKAGWFPLSFSFAILGIFQFIMSKLNNLKSFE